MIAKPTWADDSRSGEQAARRPFQPRAYPSVKNNPPMSITEQVLLVLMIITLPLESHILVLPGYSIQFVMFAVVGVYLLIRHYKVLLYTMTHPVFLAGYLFLLYAIAMEVTAPRASFDILFRIGQMILGAILIASICRDAHALTVAFLGYIVAGVWLSVLLFMTSYGAIQGTEASSFDEASRLRAEVFAENPLQADLNSMAFAAGQGAVVAVAWALLAPSTWSRNVLLGVGMFCLVATFLPLSRGGAAITALSCASVMYGFRLRGAKSLLMIAVLVISVWIVVPQAVWSRMAFTFEEQDGKQEGRALVYQAAVDHLPEYILTGVGAGNFWSSWGAKTAFKGNSRRVSGSHNSLLQVTLYWGIGGLVAFVLILWQAYRCLPYGRHNQAASLCLLGVSVSLLLYAQVVHTIYAKEFCIGLGLLAGSDRWIWPSGVLSKQS